MIGTLNDRRRDRNELVRLLRDVDTRLYDRGWANISTFSYAAIPRKAE